MSKFVSSSAFLATAALLAWLAACESGGTSQAKDENRTSNASTKASDDEDVATEKASGQNWEISEKQRSKPPLDPGDVPPVGSKLELSESEWRERLTGEEFHILREAGTERAHTGDLLDNDRRGIYYCAGCGAPLFSSRHKFKSNTGWPSFYRPFDPERLGTRPDKSLGMTRTEVHCARCGGHLGHIFDDGPEPTGKRYCINSVALDFEPAEPVESSEGIEASAD